jgi:hypothetical protein
MNLQERWQECIMPLEAMSMACVINPPHQYYQHYNLSNCWGNTLNITRMPEPIGMTFHIYIMPSEIISTVYLTNPSRYYYQHYNLSNCRGNNLKITWMPQAMFMKFGKHVVLSGAISTVYLMNQSLSNINTAASQILLCFTSLRIQSFVTTCRIRY